MPCRRPLLPALLALLVFAIGWALPARAQGPRATVPFLAQHYDVSATLDGVSQLLTATAKVEFRALEVTSTLRVELHPNLEVKSVKNEAGKSLQFERDTNPLYVLVNLPAAVPRESKLTLTFEYSGLLANAENSPVPGIKVALIDRELAYLLLPSRWFPLTNYPSNRYTATFRLNVPDTWAVAGTGKALAAQPMASTGALAGGLDGQADPDAHRPRDRRREGIADLPIRGRLAPVEPPVRRDYGPLEWSKS